MGIFIKKSEAVFLVLFVINLTIAILATFFLPKRFFYDTIIIINDKYNEIGLIGSYPFSIFFYKVTGLKYLPFFIIALIQFPILIYTLYKIGIPKNFHLLNVKNSLVYITFTMMALFISIPSKEFITFLYLSVIVFIYKKQGSNFQKSLALSIALLIFFGIFFRPYFLLVPIIAIGMYLLSFINFKNKTTATIFYGLLIAIFISLSYGIVKGKYISQASREQLNMERLGSSDANSVIVSPIATNTWYGEAIGVIYGFFSVNLPINGLKHFLSPQILAFVIWQILLFYILLVRYSKCLKNKKEYQSELWILLILFSYFIVQGVFEPDLGSATRHKIGIFPLIYYALYYEYFRKELR